MAYDRGDYHFEDAGTWEKACRHIGLYLAWAIDNDLASTEVHDDKAAAKKNPTGYFIGACDTKLWAEDFTADGNAFTEAIYGDYCKAVSAYAKKLKCGDYEIPDNRTTRDHFGAWLDAKLSAFTKATARIEAANKIRSDAAAAKKKPAANKKPAATKQVAKKSGAKKRPAVGKKRAKR